MNDVIKFIFLFLLGVISATIYENKEVDVEDSSKILSRRKRFIVFPDGSSFQLVFCAQNQGYLKVGDVVWFGNTAALAWQLPSDPQSFYLFKDHNKFHEAQRRNGITKTIYFLDEHGKVLTKMPYRKKPIINPAFAKRSIDDSIYSKRNMTQIINQLHDAQLKNDFMESLDKDSVTFHREGRKSLYAKLEKFLHGMGWRGRECLLRMLCETGRGKTEQGTFLQEIMRATLTLPQGKKFDTEYYNEYDKAHFSDSDCETLYPQCEKLY
ncbi:unnamed protein product [Parnassius apollo]|uniref:(apollo) hypothetical protein n=1 Tax=Parnassius apollo TaxID=110799 RepID=A0A8S3W4I8_PARAO|nr:unnamed protein product [Parnassius apollo]